MKVKGVCGLVAVCILAVSGGSSAAGKDEGLSLFEVDRKAGQAAVQKGIDAAILDHMADEGIIYPKSGHPLFGKGVFRSFQRAAGQRPEHHRIPHPRQRGKPGRGRMLGEIRIGPSAPVYKGGKLPRTPCGGASGRKAPRAHPSGRGPKFHEPAEPWSD